ncbi:hypothetical protein DPMN_113836 [Dreissena polymorpha]|uniref:Uncharacterized protein n=1 Tax=Dreissena polymorpha TaxID=45954 RepID=A0A9D4QRE2_DREPO|nr:hypothetical protein DPMN_113836 [Dreissena polymorpha]
MDFEMASVAYMLRVEYSLPSFEMLPDKRSNRHPAAVDSMKKMAANSFSKSTILFILLKRRVDELRNEIWVWSIIAADGSYPLEIEFDYPLNYSNSQRSAGTIPTTTCSTSQSVTNPPYYNSIASTQASPTTVVVAPHGTQNMSQRTSSPETSGFCERYRIVVVRSFSEIGTVSTQNVIEYQNNLDYDTVDDFVCIAVIR